MPTSLIPERPLLISPTLAATIGLEEAVMLHVISELQNRHQTVFRSQLNWFQLRTGELQQALPFWNDSDIKRIQQSLTSKGLILNESPDKGVSAMIAINQRTDAAEEPAQAILRPPEQASSEKSSEVSRQDLFSRNPSGGSATPISPFWQPENDLYQICEQQHQIPRKFIAERVKSFVMFQRERGNTQYSWHNTFLKWIMKEWREDQSYQGAKELEGSMSSVWAPSDDATEILEHAGVPADFIEDAIPEFVLYWRERGLVTSTWNTKFIAHVRRQWAKFSAEVAHDNSPCLVPVNFNPSAACFEVLAMANIDEDFAREQLQEFILYWQERGEASSSWNSRFLQHVKFKWANRPQAGLPASQQMADTIARMTDRSWAE